MNVLLAYNLNNLDLSYPKIFNFHKVYHDYVLQIYLKYMYTENEFEIIIDLQILSMQMNTYQTWRLKPLRDFAGLKERLNI